MLSTGLNTAYRPAFCATKTVLFAEDDNQIRKDEVKIVQEVCEENGDDLNALEAATFGEARQHLMDHDCKFDLVVTDGHLSDTQESYDRPEGLVIAHNCARKSGADKVIMVSGNEALRKEVEGFKVTFIKKPFNGGWQGELRSAAAKALYGKE